MGEGAVAAASALTEEEAEEFDLLEETMPLDTLIVWRTLVHEARKKEARQQQLLMPGRELKRRKSRTGTAGKGAKEGGTLKPPASGATAAAEEAATAAPVAGVGGWISSWWSGGKKQEQEQPQGRDSSDSDADFQDTLEEELQGGEDEWQDVVEEAGQLEGAKEEEEEVQEGDISLDELCAQADSSLPDTPPVKADTELFSFRLRTTSIITLFAKRSAPLLELTSSLDLEARQKGDTFSAAVRLPTFALQDLYTDQALFSHIAKAGDHTGGRGEGLDANPSGESRHIFDLSFITSPKSTSVRIRTRPLDLVYNRGWLAQVLLILRPSPDLAEALAQQAVENIAKATAVVTSDVLGKVGLVADIEIAAPRIFVPLAETVDKGFLLLDTGHLAFKGGTKAGDPSSSEWELRLSRIQSR